MFILDVVKESLMDSTISDLREVINYCNDQIKLQQGAKAASLKQQIAELQSQLDEIEPQKNGTRNYKGITNPNNSDQVYTTGPHPIWLTQMLKDALGDKYGDKTEMAKVIAELRNGGVQ